MFLLNSRATRSSLRIVQNSLPSILNSAGFFKFFALDIIPEQPFQLLLIMRYYNFWLRSFCVYIYIYFLIYCSAEILAFQYMCVILGIICYLLKFTDRIAFLSGICLQVSFNFGESILFLAFNFCEYGWRENSCICEPNYTPVSLSGIQVSRE